MEYLLAAALEAPGAASSAGAGKVVAALLSALSRAGGDKAIASHLLPGATGDAGFEIRCYTGSSSQPSRTITGLNGTGAIRIAVNLARQGDEALEVVGRDATGRPLCVLTRAESGPLEYRFPDVPPPHQAQPGTKSNIDRLPDQPAPYAATSYNQGALEELIARQTDVLSRSLNSRLDRVPDAEEISRIVQSVLGEMTVEVDLHGAPSNSAGGDLTSSQPMPESAMLRQPSAAEVADLVVARLVDQDRVPRASELAEIVARSTPMLGSGDQPAMGNSVATGLHNVEAGLQRVVDHVYSETTTLANAVRMVVDSLGDLASRIDFTEQRLDSRMQRLEEGARDTGSARVQGALANPSSPVPPFGSSRYGA
ncbi:MAG: hypothetical protein DLM54_03990 [Acidimicrobiales bacterium]|nr:MAG: hypothetical protein DLM54_03990 [Acidimicrobiales bacterium]